MAQYECTRLVECVVMVEAESEDELKVILGTKYDEADPLVEDADVVVYAADWQCSEVGASKDDGFFSFVDSEIAIAVSNAPEPWVL